MAKIHRLAQNRFPERHPVASLAVKNNLRLLAEDAGNLIRLSVKAHGINGNLPPVFE
ncbi:hypothetical protein JJT43_002464 [Salmonella enterica]|nr:hypothetical protein [Salmonella enterica]EHI6281683.1 hypothetical protein [Salmonella enterica]